MDNGCSVGLSSKIKAKEKEYVADSKQVEKMVKMTEILGLYQYLSSNLALGELCVSGCVLKFEVRSTIAVEALLVTSIYWPKKCTTCWLCNFS